VGAEPPAPHHRALRERQGVDRGGLGRACAYAVIVACFVTRDLRLRQLPAVLVEGGALVGAVLILLSVALGLTSYLVDAQLPEQFLAWVRTHIHSQLMFLARPEPGPPRPGQRARDLLRDHHPRAAGDPMGRAFEVDPIHLGVIFLANLERASCSLPWG